MRYPRLVIAAPKSGSGKTMFTMGLLRALQKKNRTPCSFKCGPDFIDPMYHSRVLDIPSKNLDTFFTDKETTLRLFSHGAKHGDISIIEGVMGYFDGASMTTTQASTFDVARTLQADTVLIVDAKGMGRSLLALLKGFLEFDQPSQIKGVIFNRISAMTYEKLKPMVEEELHIRVYGFLPQMDAAAIESRHLGLQLPGELADFRERLERLSDQIVESVDVDGLLSLAQAAPELPDIEYDFAALSQLPQTDRHTTIAVARDEAFCFLYEDNLNVLRAFGRLVFFSPLHDEKLPAEADALLLPGGYPENYAKQLSENVSMRESILRFAQAGGKVLAECGGFLYLMKTLTLADDSMYPMVGLIDADGFWTGRLGRFGYIELEGDDAKPLIRGHEFHYFDTTDNGRAFIARKPYQDRAWECMHRSATLLAGFPHLYYPSNPDVIGQFLS